MAPTAYKNAIEIIRSNGGITGTADAIKIGIHPERYISFVTTVLSKGYLGAFTGWQNWHRYPIQIW